MNETILLRMFLKWLEDIKVLDFDIQQKEILISQFLTTHQEILTSHE